MSQATILNFANVSHPCVICSWRGTLDVAAPPTRLSLLGPLVAEEPHLMDGPDCRMTTTSHQKPLSEVSVLVNP